MDVDGAGHRVAGDCLTGDLDREAAAKAVTAAPGTQSNDGDV